MRTYPRVEHATLKPHWDKKRAKPQPNQKPIACCVCGEPATHQCWVEVNWFRGDDEGPFKACKAHRHDALALLATRKPPAQEAAQ